MSGRLVYLAPGLPGLPEELMLARDRGDVLFLTGAGVSMPEPSGLPLFRGLVVQIAKKLDGRLGEAMEAWAQAADVCAADAPAPLPKAFAADLDPRQHAELARFVRGDYDVVLGMLERRLPVQPGATSRMRVAASDILDAAHRPNSLHLALNVLARRNDQLSIATTNFDRLHERAAKRPKPASYGLEGLPRPSRAPEFHGVFHIHGVLEPSQSRQLVLTDQDFGDLYLRRRLTSDFLYDATRIFHLVIVGYSLNDAPFRYLMNAVAGDTRHFSDLKDRYALVPRREGDLVVQADWSGRSLIPICYDQADDHAELARLLDAWAESVPQPTADSWTRKRLRAMIRNTYAEASEADQSVFGYIYRRASGTERISLTRLLGESGASPDWLTAANALIREDRTVG